MPQKTTPDGSFAPPADYRFSDRSDKDIELHLAALDAPDQLVSASESRTIRRETSLPALSRHGADEANTPRTASFAPKVTDAAARANGSLRGSADTSRSPAT